jgi:hypothetical protein
MLFQNTSRVVMCKLFSSADHLTPATGKTPAVTIAKNDPTTFSNPSAGATTAVEVGFGWYKTTLSTTDTNTLGDLVVRLTATGCDDGERFLEVTLAGDAYALLNNAQTEIGQGAPAATAPLKDMIRHLYKAWRNKVTETANQYSVFADDGVTVDQKAVVSNDGTTFTRGKIGTGP